MGRLTASTATGSTRDVWTNRTEIHGERERKPPRGGSRTAQRLVTVVCVWRSRFPLLVAGALVVAACSGSSDDAGDQDTPAVSPDTVTATAGDAGSLDWAPCAEQNPIVETECAVLEVPLDHADLGAGTLDVAVARVRSADPETRIGSLVFNPGGPGGSGVEFLAQVALLMPPGVTDRFDLVGFDPRGVGASTAVTCDVEIDDSVALVAAGDDEAYAALVDQQAADLAACTDETFDVAPYLGTNNAARDLDLLREALGDDGLSYVGYSYGTRLGATYAELFPERVRALVLDAAVKPTTDSIELDLGQAEGFDRALRNFADACDDDPDCLLQELGPALDVVDGLRREIAEVGSFPTDDGDRILTPGELDYGIIAALYSKDAWPFLAQALFTAEVEQDGTLLQVLGDGLAGRRADGTYDNSSVANTFINCADTEDRPDVDRVRADAETVAERSEFFSDALRASTGCLGLPQTEDALTLGAASDAPPILVIGNTGDPATPYEWSVELAEFLDSGVLYTVEAEGHTAFGTIPCVTQPVVDYLVDLTVPDADASCSDNATADFFVPEGDSEVDRILALLDCLRENGADVAEITAADILADSTGEVLFDALDVSDPAFIEAAGACEELLLDLSGGS